MSLISGRLWVVATPLGNLGDFPPRAIEVLRACSLILAEDTRRAGRFLAAVRVDPPWMISFFEHNEEQRLKQVLELLRSGQEAALISDAGTPVVSDPGYRLVRACRENRIPVSTVPGPSAPVAALSISGLPTVPFVFLGFLSRRAGEVTEIFEKWNPVQATLVFFERKNRLARTLTIAREVLGDREYSVCRELTKKYEEVIRGNLADIEPVADLRGEVTVVLGPPLQRERTGNLEAREVLEQELARGLKPKQAAREAAGRIQGWTGKELYRLLHERDFS
ncbi:MAG: 16S rRNA (cytidine(1402)-2'-O)-methyltransferase [Desulfonatronovibrionaceae bacterium]